MWAREDVVASSWGQSCYLDRRFIFKIETQQSRSLKHQTVQQRMEEERDEVADQMTDLQKILMSKRAWMRLSKATMRL